MNSYDSMTKSFRYCPRCSLARLSTQGMKVLKCANCGFEYYLNPAATVAALIIDNDGNMLVTVRAKEPAKGTWDLPGGFVDPGESSEDALRREVKEELNLDIISMTYLYSVPNVYEYNQVTYSTLDLAYLCRVKDASKARALDDVDSVFLKSAGDIDPDKFGLSSIRKIVSRYIDTLSK